MKKIAFLIIASLLTTITIAQTWNLELATPISIARDLALYADEDGYMYHRTSQPIDFIKVDEFGTLSRVFDHNLPSLFQSATKIQKSNQDYIISTSPGRLYRMDQNGNILWQVDASVNLSSPQIVTRRLSSFVILNNQIYFSAKDALSIVDISNGTVNMYPIGIGYTTLAMQNDGSDIVLLAENNSQYDILVFDNNGTLKSTYSTGIMAQDFIVSDDGYVVVGTDNGNAAIKVIDRNGGQVWSQTYGTGIFYSVIQSENNYVACGSENSNTGGSQLYDGVLTKVDENGVSIWSKTFEQIIKDGSRTRIINANQNRGYVFGTTTHLIKTDLDGNSPLESKTFYPNGTTVLDGNNIQSLVTADGQLFYDGQNGMFRVPADSMTNTITAAGLWIGGFDAGNNLQIAADLYRSGGNTDFAPGYIGTAPEDMRKVWKITQAQIRELRRDFDNNGVIDKAVPFDILTYPAKDNPNYVGLNGNTTSLSTSALPYFDRNNDAIYNVYDGDYPFIKGDVQLMWIMNDNVLHTQTLGDPLEFDIIGTLYANECNGNGLIDNSIFLNYRFINRSVESIDSLHIGMWTDFDLGCYLDDYIGSLPSLNSYYVYNGDAVDGQTGCTVADFGTNIPIQSVTYLNQPLDYFIHYSNGQIDSSTTIQSATDYYDFLTGSWTDGNPITTGGTGYNSSSTPTNHVFPGNPSNNSEWSMASENLTPRDYRTIGSTNYGSLSPAGIFEFEMAFITHDNIPHPAPDITPVAQRITQIQNHYDNEDFHFDVYLGPNQELTVGQNLELLPMILIGNVYTTYSYEWSTGETTSSINATAPITYSVTVTNNTTGCSKTDAVQVYFPTSTEELVTEVDKIAVFPNPAHDVVTIDITALDNENLTVQLIDMTGRTLQTIHNQNSDFIRFDVSNVAQGVYFIAFLNENLEKIGTKKVVILD